MSAQDKRIFSTCVTLAHNICGYINRPWLMSHRFVHRMFLAYIIQAQDRRLIFPSHEKSAIDRAYSFILDYYEISMSSMIFRDMVSY